MKYSEFHTCCECGEPLKSSDREGLCPACQREWRIEWPARAGEAVQEKRDLIKLDSTVGPI